MDDWLKKALEEYADLYAEIPENIYNYFQLLVDDKKPAVHIEIYDKDYWRVKEFKKKLEVGFFVFQNKDETGHRENLSVSKLKSVARWLSKMDKDRFSHNAGAIGLILGYTLKDILSYVRRIHEDSILEI